MPMPNTISYSFTSTLNLISSVPVTTGAQCSLPLEYLNLIHLCPDLMEPKSDVHCYPTCHEYKHMCCPAYSRHCQLMNRCISKSYFKCPRNHRRHSMMFASGVPKPNSVMWPPRLFQQYIISRHGYPVNNLLQHVYDETSRRTYWRTVWEQCTKERRRRGPRHRRFLCGSQQSSVRS